MQKLTSGGINIFRAVVISFIFLSFGTYAEDEYFVRKKKFLDTLKSAPVLDEAMFDLYMIPSDVLAERPIHVPLVFQWSDPVFRYTNNEKDKISLLRVSSRYMAQKAIQDYAGKLASQMKCYLADYSDGPVKANVDVYSNQFNYGYNFSVSNRLLHAKQVVVNNWDTLPGYGSWVACSPAGKKWTAGIEAEHQSSMLTAKYFRRFVNGGSVFKQDALFDKDLIETINNVTQKEKILGVRIQIDGDPGAFYGGYLINGKKSGLWCYMTSTGHLQFEYLIEGMPVTARVTTHTKDPKSYKIEHINNLITKNGTNYICTLRQGKAYMWDTSFGCIEAVMRNGKLSSLGGLEREGAAIMDISWDETGKPEAWVRAESLDPVYGLFDLFGNSSDGNILYFFLDGAILLGTESSNEK
jgi:hypothetical protein